MARPRLLIIKTGAAFAEARRRFGDFEDWFARALGRGRFDYRTVNVCDDHPLPSGEAIDDYAGAVVTGSPAMVSHRLDWSEATAEWLQHVIVSDRLPVLGVCYGHQLMAHALGGRVGPNPNGRQMGTQTLQVAAEDDALLGPLWPRSPVHVTHLEAVLQPPTSARVLGQTRHDPHHALRFAARSWGVQFHPEFDAAIMRCYVQTRSDLLEGEGLDSRAILEAVKPTESGDRLLDRFASICEAHTGKGP